MNRRWSTWPQINLPNGTLGPPPRLLNGAGLRDASITTICTNKAGNLISCDGHAEYKKNTRTSSLDWGLVDAAGRDSPYEPTEAHSRALYFYR